MDSANSGSMQSSSGGDEEYDSSSHPHDNFLLNPQTNQLVSSNPSTFMYSYNNILQPFSPSTSSLYNNNIQDFSSKNRTSSQSNLDRPFSEPDHHQLNVAKNPKKRTRASRRTPTTVLTTDTANFRQMVQEFTGIPATPFSAAATSEYSRRLHLFAAAARGESLIYRPSSSSSLLPYNITTTSDSFQQTKQLNMQGNTSQESSRNIPILDDDHHFGSFNAPNVQLDKKK